ncbi:hypothetical protein RB601_005970 [Gaeumannomyces tritici]
MSIPPHDVVQRVTNRKAQYARFADTKQWDKFAGLGLPDARYSYQDSSGDVVALQGRRAAFDNPGSCAAFFGAFFRKQQSLHNISLAEMTQTGPDEVEVIWAFEDQLIRNYTFWTCRMRGGGHYYEVWRKKGDEWFIADLRMQRTYQMATLGHGGTVSRAEVFGIFLTLSLCLLSQPTGSLVYRPRSILPWRLNPLASLAEAVLVLSCFAAIIVPLLFGLAIDCTFDLDSSWVTSRAEIGDLSTFGGRWRRRAKLARAARLRLRVETHALAAALLLIRGDKGQRSQKTASGVMNLVAELAASGLFPEENQGVDTNEETAGLMAAGARGGETSRQDENGAPAVAEDESRQTRSARADPNRRQEQTTVSTATPPPDTRPSQLAEGSSNSDRAALLRRVYGSNVLAHRELPVQMVTLLSVTSVAVKLCVSSLPGPLVASGAFMLLSWMTIQLLLLVFHSRNIRDTGLQALSTAVQEFSPVFDQSPSDETQWAVWLACGLFRGRDPAVFPDPLWLNPGATVHRTRHAGTGKVSATERSNPHRYLRGASGPLSSPS